MKDQDRCQEVMGVAYNEVNKPVMVQCIRGKGHTQYIEHIGMFTTGNRTGTIYWKTERGD